MLSSVRKIDRSVGTALAVVLALVGGLSLAGPARALDDDGRQNVFTSVLGLLQLTPAPEQADIDYRERPPLALPPKIALPAPVAQPQRNAAWPNDPDVMRRKAEAAKLKMPALFTRNGESDHLLTKEQLMSGRGAAAAAAAGPTVDPSMAGGRACKNGRCEWISPTVLAAEGAATKTERTSGSGATIAGTEPDRRFLTDPPKGYRRATVTVKATTEAPTMQTNNSDVSYWHNPFKSSSDDE